MKITALLAVGAIALTVAACGSGPSSDCQPLSNAAAIHLMDPSPDTQLGSLGMGQVEKAATLVADGGNYSAVMLTDGTIPVWWQQGGKGLTFSVGHVTALYSIFPDSEQHSGISVASPGFDAVQNCVK